ncbi:MAG: cyclic nucleotide-binding domain-containing protein [Acidobacteriota bacterium]|nr:cyclic nucleotide-binding domain-containing protein [Acidobacteriota bacterium]
MALFDVLKAHEFTLGLTEEQVRCLASLAREVTFAENDVVLVDGQRSTCFYLLLTGSVVVELRTPQYVVCVQSLGGGSVFGWSSLLDHQDTLFQVRAREQTLALEIDGARMKQRCFQDPALGAAILHRVLNVVAGRVKATEVRFAEMCGVKV